VLHQPGLKKLKQSEKLENPSVAKDSEVSRSSESVGGAASEAEDQKSREIGGYKGAEPTRFGDWEKNGRCIDF
jgi:hypothetical protein